jgi:hypothetical protein
MAGWLTLRETIFDSIVLKSIVFVGLRVLMDESLTL